MAKKDSGKPPSLMALMREALNLLGKDAKPPAISEWLQTNHKREVSLQQISSYKSMINNSTKSGKIKVLPPSITATASSSSSSSSSKGGAAVADLLEFVAIVREWEEKIGEEAIRDVFEALY